MTGKEAETPKNFDDLPIRISEAISNDEAQAASRDPSILNQI